MNEYAHSVSFVDGSRNRTEGDPVVSVTAAPTIILVDFPLSTIIRSESEFAASI